MKYILPVVIFLGSASGISGMDFAKVKEHIDGHTQEHIKNALKFVGCDNPQFANEFIKFIADVQKGRVSEHNYQRGQRFFQAELLRKPSERLLGRRASTGNVKLPY